MACRWPGEASSPSKLWDMLVHERSGYTQFDDSKLHLDGFYHPNQHRPGSIFTKGGYFLKEDPKLFDHSFFGITPVEAMTMDPAQRKLLEVTYEAFENAGESWDHFSGSNTGVFVGNFNYDHQLMQVRDADHPLPYVTTGGGITILSNRINYVFNLHGPSMTVDTACSSSMYALHLAVSSIRSGECKSAIVGGSNLVLGPEAQLFTTKLGAISPTSTCHTFDASADGYARADGFGALYVKKLSDALANKDPIRAVIRATAINANGRTGGISHPSPEGQEAVMRRAYEAAGGLDPDLTGYCEVHGTGTAVGDPLEVSAVGKLFAAGRKEEPLLIGSIKPSLGHSESSSGLAGVMKAVLAVEHGKIPATIGLVNPNPNIDFDGAKVKVVTEMTPWPVSKPIRRASINSFGYGGANAHAIIESVESFVPGYSSYSSRSSSEASSSFASQRQSEMTTPPEIDSETDEKPVIRAVGAHHRGVGAHDVEWAISKLNEQDSLTMVSSQVGVGLSKSQDEQSHLMGPASHVRRLILLPFSGHDEHSLKANIAAVSQVADEYDPIDLAYTLGARRSKFFQRAFAIGEPDSLGSALEESRMVLDKSSASVQQVGYVFTGQGAQWAGMGAELFAEFEVYRRRIRSLDETLSRLPDPPGWTLESALLEPAASSRVHEPEFSQPLCTALQIGVVDLLASWHVKPMATVGHSSGEIAAAYAAGTHTAEEAIVMAYYRGKVLALHTTPGLMLAVGLGPEDVSAYLERSKGKAVIAAVNSPRGVTLSGDEDAITDLKRVFDEQKTFARLLQTGGKAYHSPHMAALGESYERLTQAALQSLSTRITHGTRRDPALWISSVDPSTTPSSNTLTPAYWRKNLESPVLFGPAVETLAKTQGLDLGLLVEIGPHAALAGPLRQIRAELDARDKVKLAPCLGSIVRGEDGFRNMLSLAGNLFIRNVSVDIAAVNSIDTSVVEGAISTGQGTVIADLPNYQFHYGDPIYYESRYNKEWRLRKHLRHDVLGAKQSGCAKGRPSWRNMLRLKDVPWLDDHKLLPAPIFPAAGYLAMAVEAMSQHHHDEAGAPPIVGFSFRSVAINSTMQVPDDDVGVETILNLQATTLTNSKASDRWHEFKISSLQNDAWTEHCQGLICVETQRYKQDTDFLVDPKSKAVDSVSWYKKFADVGLGYGPTFQGLSEIRARPGVNRATAQVALHSTKDTIPYGESSYPVHPATIDLCLQLALMACHAGQTVNVRKAFVPVVAHEMSLWIPDVQDNEADFGYGQASGELRGLRGAYASTELYGKSGQNLINIRQLRCVAYDGTSSAGTEAFARARNPYLRLVWKPDIDSITNEEARALFPPTTDIEQLVPTFDKFDRLSACILVQIFCGHSHLFTHTHAEHLDRFLNWVRRCYVRAQRGELPHGRTALSYTQDQRKHAIEQLSGELSTIVEAQLIKRIYDQLLQIFSGETSGLHVALQDNLLTELYISGIGISGGYPQLLRAIDLLSHKSPSMKILEIGAGTGGATRLIMDTLDGRSQFKRYGSYCFTDVGTSFLSTAQEEFSQCASVDFKPLDIEKNPLEQGFEPDYDMIVASQVLHATTTIAETVQHARSLLKPGGKMVLLEITNVHLGTGLVLGTFPDYWNGVADGRVDSPLLTKDMWQQVLLQNGFSGIDILLDDHASPVSMASVIVTTAVEPTIARSISRVPDPSLVIAHGDVQPSFGFTLEDVAMERSVKVTRCSIRDAEGLQDKSRIIVLADLLDSFLMTMDEADLASLRTLFGKASSLVWVTAGGLIEGSRPENALIVGLMRAIITEMPHVKIMTIDLEADYDPLSQSLADTILSKEDALQQINEHTEAVDAEYSYKDGLLHCSRLIPDTALNERFLQQEGSVKDTELVPLQGQGPLGIGFDQAGLLSSLYFKQDSAFDTPLKAEEIEVEVRAVGLNTKDLAVALGRFDWNSHSTECSGVVSKVGSQVSNVKVGDMVFGAAPGNFGNYVRVRGQSMQKMEATDTFEQVASMPVVFMTAIYSLNHLAHLKQGETVLIQSATGGLGMAAIRLAKHIGAEIYATVGNTEKMKVLTTEFDIAEDRIFNSRELSTPSKILAATGGNGVDVILCSAAGEAMHESWRAVAPMGRFVEVGRTDVLEHGKLSLEVFRRNATFSSFDLGLMNQQKPAFVASLMAELGHLYRQGVIRPIDHITTFDISQIEQAMMHFAKGTHLGKVVVTFQDPQALLKVRPTPKRVTFDSGAAYLLAGCLGGLGQSIGSWMAERGARNLVYLSRSGAANSGATKMLDELHAIGVSTRVLRCDITKESDVKTAISQISLPIKGVIQAAMVVNDSTFDNLTTSQFASVTEPKVKGTINLHRATLDQPLDFFTMTSSIVTMIGTASQGSYCAGNAFQDAFARHRHSLGLPAQAFALGMILEVGFVSALPQVQQSLMRNGVYGTGEHEFLRIFEASLLRQQQASPSWVQLDPHARSHLLTGLEPVKLDELYRQGLAADFTWHTDARFSLLLQAIADLSSKSAASSSSAASITEALKSASPTDFRSIVTTAILERLSKLLFTPSEGMDPSKAVSEYGMDSMIAAELRNWFVKSFGTDVTFLELLNPATKIKDLVEKVAKAWEKE
ncbi:MAG: hypothetical protein LQ352_006197 [Teloschistes flavicans]|nr:MAG: hypothetical protein LQ352_006197 [Teloschistes flavicans]